MENPLDSNNYNTSQTPFHPSVGLGLLHDYNPTTNVYTVPIVNESLLEQKGGNYITEFVPPKLILKDGQKLVLVTRKVLLVYGITEIGNATVNADGNGNPIVPSSRNIQVVNSQLRKSSIVSEREVGEKGLISMIGEFPRFHLHLSTDNSPNYFRAVPEDFASKYALTSIGVFSCPKDNAQGPYPLKLAPKLPRGSYKEMLSIPPPLKRTHRMEFMNASAESIACVVLGSVVGIIIFLLAIRWAYNNGYM